MYKQAPLDLPDLLRGTTYAITVNLTDENGDPLDLSGFSGAGKGLRGQIRATKESSTVLVTPTWAISAPSSSGTITCTIASTSTTSISPVNAFYDVEAYDSNQSPEYVEPLIGGRIKIVREVTRS